MERKTEMNNAESTSADLKRRAKQAAIRNWVFLLAGIGAALVAGCGAKRAIVPPPVSGQAPQAQNQNQVIHSNDTPLLPGSGSGIRVVGGSITIMITPGSNLTLVPVLAANQVTQLSATSGVLLDASTFELEGVSQAPGGDMVSVTYGGQDGQGLTKKWVIDDFVTDSKKGVKITGVPTNHAVTFDVEKKGDLFKSVPPTDWQYSDESCPQGQTRKSCETVVEIHVNTAPDSATPVIDTWYCVATSGQCHVDIGSAPLAGRGKQQKPAWH
jgi:hypothetical protein